MADKKSNIFYFDFFIYIQFERNFSDLSGRLACARMSNQTAPAATVLIGISTLRTEPAIRRKVACCAILLGSIRRKYSFSRPDLFGGSQRSGSCRFEAPFPLDNRA
ncbi:unnamed protein product [Protopolystoma xenopodis]|uniref:Uncharacterized protein n=1 Tax=Protopolystoma xenopodis TaxID=117903 RepID=A0A3S5A3H8_9PLAT|nr:unnamed protein product [Protopolystoma xenopodis]